MHWPFQPNREYRRAADVHGAFGGQPQGGIVTPKDVLGIFAFTGAIGKTIGYADSFQGDGSFRYTGEGQVGPMRFVRGNRALRDAGSEGKDILLFEILGKGKPVRFIGTFSCAGWEYETQPDRNGNDRQAIVFILVPIENINAQEEVEEDTVAFVQDGSTTDDLATLRIKALAAGQTGNVSSKSGSTIIFERSRDVRRYVLARAQGVCEGCQQAAPFHTPKGHPFLEAHHIRRLTDGGPDDIRHVAGVCPNCHRRAHHSSDRAAFNEALSQVVAQFEDAWV